MSTPSHGRRARRSALALISAGALVAGFVGAVPAATAAGDRSGAAHAHSKHVAAGRYIVLLREPSATRVSPGATFRADSAKVKTHKQHLKREQQRIARSVGAEVDRSYTVASNGFLAQLTARQASKLSTDKDVLALTEDVERTPDTWNTPDHLGLAGPGGAWAEHSGAREDAGDGVVVGVLDSGIWPESASFAGAPLTAEPSTQWNIVQQGETVTMDKADGGVFTGRCQTSHAQRNSGAAKKAEGWALSDCNAKVVGARYYPQTFLDQVKKHDRAPAEYISTRDGDGHGSHTASTAAGNVVDDVTTEGRLFGTVSGMAPAAKVAAYKVCFNDNDPDTGGCYTSAILDAIDDAVTDGVDVINYSISGATDTVIDAVEFAFEGAAEAGVFVATSAGNSGPEASTVAHNSPWLTTVAANTHVNFNNTVVLGDGTKIRGASIAGAEQLPAAQTPLVNSADVAAAGADPEDAELCVPGSLDPARVTGTIVLCTRGVIARVDKSAAVAQAGGVATILANVTPGSLDADFHSVSTIHITDTDSPQVFDYVAAGSATAAFESGDTTGQAPTPIPQVAGFSSRGPATANGGDLLKPDISAPGVSVLAAVAPPSNSGRDYDLYSGTSMASPHIAGLAAFILGEHPEWSPMQVKSAMMTTADSLKRGDGTPSTDLFATGAGEVDPGEFFDPGLFVTSDAQDWYGFIQGQGLDIGVQPLAAKDLNGPSMVDSQVVGRTSFTREFTATRKGGWDVYVDVPGFTASTDRRLNVKAGQTKALVLDLARTTAPFDQWAMGYLTLTGPTTVRLPIAVKPTRVAAPAEVSGTGTDGSVEVPVTVGDTLDVTEHGLVAAQTAPGSTTSASEDASDLVTTCVTVTEGNRAARFALDALDDTADMDLFVYEGCGAPADPFGDFLAFSATGSADETVTLESLPAGDYLVAVDPYAMGDAATLEWRLDSYLVQEGAGAGNLSVIPDPLLTTTTSYTASWSGLDAGTRYLGVIEYGDLPGLTYVSLDTGAP